MNEPRNGSVSWPEGMGLLAILVLSLALRLEHLDTLLPWFTYEDEVRTTSVTLRLLREWTIDPQHSFYPALPFYINAVAYWLWAVPGMAGAILRDGISAVAPWFASLSETDPRLIGVSRWVSLGFGMGAIFFSHLLFRQYLDWRWALFTTLLLGLNTVAVAMATVAKTDSLYLFWFAAGYYATVKYFHRGGWRWLIFACACAGFGLVTKNSYQLVLGLSIFFLVRNLRGKRGCGGLFRNRELWVLLTAIPLFALVGSPYSFIRLRETLVTAGWLYAQAEIISTYHTDPHVWWLDRYYYLASVVLPFLLGLPVFWLAIPATVHHLRQRSDGDLFVFINLVWFIYIFASNSGGPRGGAFPYYLFLVAVPLALLVVSELAADLAVSPSRTRMSAGYAIAAVILVVSLARVFAFHDLFFAPYDRLGPYLRAQLPAGSRTLMVSVYKPGPGLSNLEIKSVWPHELDQELIRQYDPDFIVIDGWVMAGFRKFYRELPVAPLVDSYLSGTRGYDTILNEPANYFGRGYYAAIDLEHDVSVTVLKKAAGPRDNQP